MVFRLTIAILTFVVALMFLGTAFMLPRLSMTTAYTDGSYAGRWSSNTIYYWNDASSSDQAPAANAVAEWNLINTNINLQSVSTNSSANISIQSYYNLFDNRGGYTNQVWSCAGNSCTMSRAVSWINDALDGWPDFSSIEEIAAHELGHALSLGHENYGNEPDWNLMNGNVNAYSAHKIMAPMRDEVNAMTSLYGQKLHYQFSKAVTSGDSNVYYSSTSSFPIEDWVSGTQAGYAFAYDPSHTSLPSSNVVLLTAIVASNGLYRSALGVWGSTNPTDTTKRIATIEVDNDGVKYVYYDGPKVGLVVDTISSTAHTGDEYYLELVIQNENGQSTAHAYVYDYTSDTWLGEADSDLYFGWGLNPVYMGIAAWTDAPGDPTSNYWISQPASIGMNWLATSPDGNCYGNFGPIQSSYGAAWEADTKGCSGGNPSYSFYMYPYNAINQGTYVMDFDNMTVPNDQKITISGWFMKSDTFSPSLAPGRSYEKVYVVDPYTGSIYTSKIILDYTYTNGQYYYKTVTIDLSGKVSIGTSIKIAFGRENNWATDYSLEAAAADVLVTPG
ncbi:MAG TPA: hypothetical protein VJN71_09465 [Nitrososphaerales archaeon]|nr:hypothetical protein [Nitrososphaerales archaeon]